MVLALAACTSGGSSTANQGFSPAKPPIRTASYMIATDVCGGPGSTPEVLSFAAGDSGNVAPFTDINGGNTQLDGPWQDYVDSHGIVWVANGNNQAGQGITAYASTANGNVAPLHDISGSNTTLSGSGMPLGVTTDSAGNVYVSDFFNGAIDVFAAGSYGNVAPVRRITGANTQISFPEGIAVDSSGDIWLFNGPQGSPEIAEFGPGANGNVAPIKTISGGNTDLAFEGDLVIDHSGNIWVANQVGPSAALEFAPDESGNDPPERAITGSNTTFVDPIGIAVDQQGYVYVSDYAAAAIDVFGPAENGNVPPAQRIAGSNTDLCQPAGITAH